ncbi:hypothetical protein P8452_28315 [Trifolium repens]|nr:hypothetical protein P8452_28315 [Trifolium repens]
MQSRILLHQVSRNKKKGIKNLRSELGRNNQLKGLMTKVHEIISTGFTHRRRSYTSWYAELKTCLSHVPEVSNKEEEAGGILENWPQRLELKTCLSHVPEVSNKEEEAGGILENWPQRLEFVSYG